LCAKWHWGWYSPSISVSSDSSFSTNCSILFSHPGRV
jgi:hypothetical protein